METYERDFVMIKGTVQEWGIKVQVLSFYIRKISPSETVSVRAIE